MIVDGGHAIDTAHDVDGPVPVGRRQRDTAQLHSAFEGFDVDRRSFQRTIIEDRAITRVVMTESSPSSMAIFDIGVDAQPATGISVMARKTARVRLGVHEEFSA